MLVNLKINNSSIKKNLEKIRSINKNVICVIKDDAYGLKIEKILDNIFLKSNKVNFVFFIAFSLLQKISKSLIYFSAYRHSVIVL